MLLASFEIIGVKETIAITKGMFAVALWDKKHKKLILIRDRAGEKPLYYGWQKGVFLFGSNISALKQHPDFIKEIDRNALKLYMKYSYVPAPK